MTEGQSHERLLEPEVVAARQVLLDALDALGGHSRAVVLVGAQALYLHAGEMDLPVAPFTTDADLAIHPGLLADEPLLAEALEAMGFELVRSPGTWRRVGTCLDLMVPASLGGSGRRGARLGLHGATIARKTTGLEAALVDNAPHVISSLDHADARRHSIAVAGPAALLVAKVHKLSDREPYPERWTPKDGLDVLRLLRAIDVQETGARLAALERDPLAGDSTQQALKLFRAMFCDGGHGVEMLLRATAGLDDPDVMARSCIVLAQQLLEVWNSR